jgi:thioesterase domain-containing protein
MYESFKTPEQIPTKEQMIEALKSQGKSVEFMEMLDKYTGERMDTIEKISDQKEHLRALIRFSMDCVEIYYKGGLKEEAVEVMEQEFQNPSHYHEEEMLDEIQAFWNKLKRESGS